MSINLEAADLLEQDDAFDPKANCDPRPWDERNDYLQSPVGPDRANRPSDVITVARNLSEVGRWSPKDPAHEGKRTQSLDTAVASMQQDLPQATVAPDITVDAAFGPQTQAAFMPKLQNFRKGVPSSLNLKSTNAQMGHNASPSAVTSWQSDPLPEPMTQPVNLLAQAGTGVTRDDRNRLIIMPDTPTKDATKPKNEPRPKSADQPNWPADDPYMIYEPEISIPNNLTGSERCRVDNLLKIMEHPCVRHQLLKGPARLLREGNVDRRLIRQEDAEAQILLAATLVYTKLSREEKRFVREASQRFGKVGRAQLAGHLTALTADRKVFVPNFPSALSNEELRAGIRNIETMGKTYVGLAKATKGTASVYFKAMASGHHKALKEYREEIDYRRAVRQYDSKYALV